MIDRTRFEDFARISADWFWETDTEDRFSYFSVATTRTGLTLGGRLGLRRRDGGRFGHVELSVGQRHGIVAGSASGMHEILTEHATGARD